MTRSLPWLLGALALGGCQLATSMASPRLGGPTFTLPVVASTAGTAHAATPAAPAAEPQGPMPSEARPGLPVAGAPPPSAPAGGRGAGPVAALRSFGGVVLGLDALGDRPVEGAHVVLADGRAAFTDAAGGFSFDGPPPADGAYAVSHPAFHTSAVAGLTGAAVTLHLRPRVAVVRPPDQPASATWTVTGTVVDGEGVPLPEAQIVLRDGRGSVGWPAVSRADGIFELTVEGVGGAVVDGSMLISANRRGIPYLGAIRGLSLTPGRPALGALTLHPPAHAVTVTVVAPGAPGRARITVTAVGAHGERLALPVAGGRVLVAPLPGVRYALDVDARDNDSGAVTYLHQAAIAPVFGQAQTAITAELLAVPTLASAPSLAPGHALRWAAVPGARGYQLSALGGELQGELWEAFTAGTALTVPAGPAPRGEARLTLTAWDQPGLSPFTVASIGPKALKLLPLGDASSYRRSARVMTLF